MREQLRSEPSSIHPVDLNVGRRLRARRVSAGMTQKQLAAALGITFQQIQKYEQGTNRIVASRLLELARVLGVPVEHFFQDPEARADTPPEIGEAEGARLDRETMLLVRAFRRIRSDSVRRTLIDLVRSLGRAGG